MSGLFAFLWRWSCEPLIRELLRTLLMWCGVSSRVMYGKHDKQITLASCFPQAVDWFCKSSGCIQFSWHHDPTVVMLITELPNKPVVFPSRILYLLILESISNLCLCIYLYVSKISSRKTRRHHLLLDLNAFELVYWGRRHCLTRLTIEASSGGRKQEKIHKSIN